jgi:hypothetical protein
MRNLVNPYVPLAKRKAERKRSRWGVGVKRLEEVNVILVMRVDRG